MKARLTVRKPTREITVQFVLAAPRGLDHGAVIKYMRQAIDGWSGRYKADNPVRQIRFVKLLASEVRE